jgi:hypothetical protein
MKTNILDSCPRWLLSALLFFLLHGVHAQSAPEIITQDVTLQLNENGMATLTAEQLDNGTHDNDGPVTISIDKTAFNCDDLDGNSAEIPIEFIGTKNQNTYNFGAGYNPIKQEYWYPEWDSENVYQLNSTGQYIGVFN